ncbi:YicC/YloC family endoribonuclease [Tropicimonas sediminicola]|uniref:TIGR00255 family protein n=1 Tax=Tropicimonas sediminicola TaxID=1031541 RepID=A0A239JS11_9RHOB|nr:YicC/YloC family endoribonuclease [Tropicimonas sediminicola]SNT08786.1 TIGR00255 family protein [Tropicimonas sediminicola]
MVNSMTGFASRTGRSDTHVWSWDLRSLNARGLDLRLRLPDWVEGLEPALRAQITAALKRGSVTLGLKLGKDGVTDALTIDLGGLEQALQALAQVARVAEAEGVKVAPASAAEVLALRGVQGQGAAQVEDTAPLKALLVADFEPLLADFLASRAREGEALARVLGEQLDRIESLAADASARLEGRAEAAGQALREALARIVENTESVEESRIAQELALLAVKADITEELDRLGAHVEAARTLLTEEGPIGRKLEFLTQEFNREANTLCSKSQDVALTRIGLDLKAVIDQMREQVQNVE